MRLAVRLVLTSGPMPNARRLAAVAVVPSVDVKATCRRWLVGGAVVILAAAILALASSRFDYDAALVDKPVLFVATALCAAGLAFFLCLPRLVRSGLDLGDGQAHVLLSIVFGAGLLARVVLFASVPVLEDDFYRYLWDGSVTASGQNPYAIAPADAVAGQAGAVALPANAARVLDRVSYGDLRTIYPPVAQVAFAAAYLVEPWSLTAWRTVILVLDMATFGLILLLLRQTGRSPLWVALYWWNPLVITTLFNGAHMDVVVLPPLLLALFCVGRRWIVAAAGFLALAVGAKIWPILLLPLVLRPALRSPARLGAALGLFAALIAVQFLPVLAAGFDHASGFTAYSQGWQRNSALFPLLEQVVAQIIGGIGLPAEQAGAVTRVFLALICASVSIAVAVRPLVSTADLMARAAFVIAVLLLVAPAQYPWYATWLAPFLPFQPWAAFLLLPATLPLYYTAFYFAPRQQIDIFNTIVVWVVWVPIWAMLLRDLVHRQPKAPTC